MELKSPLNVHWELTNLCNLHCVHCYQQDDGPRARLPAKATLDLIARKIVEAGVFEVTLTGGEVLLVPHLRNLVEFFNSFGVRPHITSNGMLVDDDTADWLASTDITFQISLDAADPERHNDIRRSPRAFDQAVAGVARLVSRGVDVSFAYTAAPENLEELSGVVLLAEEHGVRRVCVGEVLPVFGSAETRERLSHDSASFGKFVRGLADLREQYLGRVDVAIALISGHQYDARLREAPCTALERDLAILHDGWAYPCPFVRDSRYRLGNLLQQSVAEIWSGAAAVAFREDKTTRAGKHCIAPMGSAGPVPINLIKRPGALLYEGTTGDRND